VSSWVTPALSSGGEILALICSVFGSFDCVDGFSVRTTSNACIKNQERYRDTVKSSFLALAFIARMVVTGSRTDRTADSSVEVGGLLDLRGIGSGWMKLWRHQFSKYGE